MIKVAYKTVSIEIPRKQLVDAAKSFLLHSESREDIVDIDSVGLAKFGSPDLIFLNKAKNSLTIARINDRKDCEAFVVASVGHYLWLKEFITVSAVFLNGKPGLDMYLFSHDFSDAVSYLIDHMAGELRVHLIEYNILQIEDLYEPAIYFKSITHKEFVQDRPVTKDRRHKEAPLEKEGRASDPVVLSIEELSEFHRLKDIYFSTGARNSKREREEGDVL